ncbi:type 2 periplasmic-binding domain-containing protein [Actinomyces israelii]|uniref:extracellular solute-binding protein n=1 Tax=Actinomyces israelii TaxID=1659 RepID=UPI0025578857|nr:extracellular solute-binding protein [Actinomyces israelii]
MWQSFSRGDGVFLMAGSWLAPDLKAVMGSDVAFILPPRAAGMDKVRTTGGTGLPFAITSAAKDPNVAAAYISFITSAEAMQVLADTGNVPVNGTAGFATAEDSVTNDVMRAFSELTTDGEILPYLDYATPTFDQVLGDALQGLLDARTRPQEFTDALQAAYTEFIDG